jgi:EAL domain-containing protein (putative c-di-GMP-specific phosphodiesterase class I)
MDDPQRALLTLERLSAQGFKLSIDDFGTGYSSLAYLKKLPVDELKIDKSFVMGMEGSEDDTQIVRSTVELAHNLGLTVVAEGVETARVWELLREMRCDHAQGYYMGKPMPADEFERWTVGWVGRNRPQAAPLSAPTLH